MRRFLMALFVFLLVTRALEAQQEPDVAPTDAAVAKLIQQLSDDDFQTRERAVEKLVALGEPVRAAVQRAAQSDDPETATRAKLVLRKLATKKIDEADVHVVGLYESRDRPAIVKVAAGDKPIILVVCAYEAVTWDVRPADGANVVQVIASGYHRQTVAGVDVPVLTSSYDERSPAWFYTYDHDEEDFPKCSQA